MAKVTITIEDNADKVVTIVCDPSTKELQVICQDELRRTLAHAYAGAALLGIMQLSEEVEKENKKLASKEKEEAENYII